MPENNHKLGIKIPDTSKYPCCMGIQIYIDRERINAIGLYPIDENNRRVDLDGEMDLEFNIAELEVMNIEDIALLMNKETFDKFCEFWKMFHGKGE